jgi:hypothetical protein
MDADPLRAKILLNSKKEKLGTHALPCDKGVWPRTDAVDVLSSGAEGEGSIPLE